MWSRILELVGRGYRNRAAAQTVRLAFEAKYPEAEATHVWLRANRPLAPLAELLRAALARDPKRRPSASRLRAGFKAIAHDLTAMRWPLTP